MHASAAARNFPHSANPLKTRAITPASASTQVAAATQRDGETSNTIAGADFIDDIPPRRVLRHAAAAQPIPKIWIRLIEQRGERKLRCFVAARIAAVQIPAEQLIQFTHAAPAAPAQARDLGIHLSKPTAIASHSATSAKNPATYA